MMLFGLTVVGCGIALNIRSNLGLSPWDVFHQGLALRTSLSFGAVTIIVGAVVFLGWIPLRPPIGPGTLFNPLVVGLVIDRVMLLVDDAHGTGVLGERGGGCGAWFGVQEEIDVSMGTLGKALASCGAFACADSLAADYLVNRARPYIYSTSPPPAAAAAARAALRLASGEEGARRRENLRGLCARFRAGLRRIGVAADAPPPGAEVPIFPIVVGEAEKALALADYMMAAGVYLLAVRPPTVPPGTSRLRATLMATHAEAQIDRVLDALESGFRKLGIAPGA